MSGEHHFRARVIRQVVGLAAIPNRDRSVVTGGEHSRTVRREYHGTNTLDAARMQSQFDRLDIDLLQLARVFVGVFVRSWFDAPKMQFGSRAVADRELTVVGQCNRDDAAILFNLAFGRNLEGAQLGQF